MNSEKISLFIYFSFPFTVYLPPALPLCVSVYYLLNKGITHISKIFTWIFLLVVLSLYLFVVLICRVSFFFVLSVLKIFLQIEWVLVSRNFVNLRQKVDLQIFLNFLIVVDGVHGIFLCSSDHVTTSFVFSNVNKPLLELLVVFPSNLNICNLDPLRSLNRLYTWKFKYKSCTLQRVVLSQSIPGPKIYATLPFPWNLDYELTSPSFFRPTSVPPVSRSVPFVFSLFRYVDLVRKE